MVPCQDAPAPGPGSVPWASGQWLPWFARAWPTIPSSSPSGSNTRLRVHDSYLSSPLYWAGSASPATPGLARCLAPRGRSKIAASGEDAACWSPGTSDTANLTSQPSTQETSHSGSPKNSAAYSQLPQTGNRLTAPQLVDTHAVQSAQRQREPLSTLRTVDGPGGGNTATLVGQLRRCTTENWPCRRAHGRLWDLEGVTRPEWTECVSSN